MKNPNALAEFLQAESLYLKANGWVRIATPGEMLWHHSNVEGGRRQKNAVIYQRYIDLNGHKTKSVESP